MPIACAAYGCTNRQARKSENNRFLQFHRFPVENNELLKKWIQALRRANWKPTKYSRLCSDHFLEKDFKSKNNCKRKHLIFNAVPSVFNFPSHLKKVMKNRKMLCNRGQMKKNTDFQRTDGMNVDLVEEEPLGTEASTSIDLSNLDFECETQSMTSVKTVVQTSQMATDVLKLRKKIKILQQRLRRKRKKNI